jgi:hypothetical protein
VFSQYTVKGEIMMYAKKLIASLKANGKILREFKDTVYIPFGSEYSILLKNIDTRRVIVNVYIDGDNMTPNGFVLYGGQEVDLERSIKNNNLNEGNRFKFIERTGSIEKHRGIKLEDGLIRVEYQFEKIQPNWYCNATTWHNNTANYNPNWHNNTATYNPNILRGTTISQGLGCVSSTTTMGIVQNSVISQHHPLNATYSSTATVTTASLNDVGITVPGSVSNQKFSTASWFATEVEKHSIVIKLLGETPDNKPITQAVTVKNKPKCVTCGKQNKATAKFCTECGTGLLIPV